MKKSVKILLAVLLVTLSAATLGAQNLKTAYFTEGYSYRYHFNPAFTPTMNFAMAGLGCMDLGAESNLSVGDFLPTNAEGKTTFFMSGPKYLAGLMSHLRDNNKGDFELSESIAACGFWTGNLFHSIEINARASGNIFMPRSFIDFMTKTDLENPYKIDNFMVNARSMAEVAYGISVPVVEGLRIGARAKFLIGLENIDVRANNVVMNFDGTTYNATGDVSIEGYIPPVVYFPTKGEVAEREGTACSPERVNRIKFSEKEWGRQPSKHFLPGFGAAFDLGLSYDFCDYFTVSAAVTDLGFICWRNHSRYTSPESWSFEGYRTINENDKIADQWDVFIDDFDECFPMERREVESDKLTTMLRLTLNAGFEFRMPFYQRWSVGLLGMGKLGQDKLGYGEGRFITTVTPVDWFSCAMSYAYSSFGHSWGTFFNFTSKGVNYFMGIDSLCSIFKFKGSVPTNRTILNCSMGLSIAFGEKHDLR